MSTQFQEDLEIFGNAVEKATPQERSAYLDQACGSAERRERLERLLEAHERAGEFLVEVTASFGGTGRELRVTEGAGDRIGRYKIRERIGEGGGGVVYVAEQEEPVRRRLALKIIKLGMDTKSVIARFEAERQALAMMDHPNIARVFDAGATETGRPYFVMELVRGIRITEYCDQHKLSTGARLDLFIKVCQAVQHAHQKGIIHRDLKPSNILVTLHDGVPVPKIIDFGIAKATEGRLTEQTVYTELHQLIGTPAYMSPEQAEMSGLDIDTRSDIYSLGVLLYELLTGETPFDAQELLKSGLDAMRKTIREMEPARPSTRLSAMEGALLTTAALRRGMEVPRLVSAIRGDLDWIVMKCLEKDRTRRYETANGLSADLKRHLGNEPVLARPPSAVYRIQKAIRRNKLAFGAAAAVVLALGLGVVSSTWQAVRATRAEREQRRLAASEGRQRVEAEEQRTLAVAGKQEAERQRALAAAAATSERDSAEQARQARDSAIQAKLQAILGLADSYTSRGLEESNTRNARPALWFANAAVTARDDPDRVDANLIRLNNWLQGQWTPVATVGQADQGGDHLTFDPEDSRYLLTFKRRGTKDAPPQIWDLATELPLLPPAEFGPLGDAVWATRGQVLLGSATGHLALASMPALKILHRWEAGGAIRRVAISPDGQIVAAICGKKLLAWDVLGEADPAVAEHPADIAYVAFSPKGDSLVTATDDEGKARVFAVESNGSQSPRLRPTLGPVGHSYRSSPAAFWTVPPAFVAGGTQLVTFQDAINWYDIVSGKKLGATENAAASVELRGMTVSPDGGTLALATQTSTLYSVSSRQLIQTFNTNLYLAFSPNGGYFIHVDVGAAEVFRMQGGKMEASRAFPIVTRGGEPAFSSDRKYMAVLQTGVVQVLKVPSGPSIPPVTRRVRVEGRSSWAAFSPDGKYAFPIGKTNGAGTVRTVEVSDTVTGKVAGKPLSLDADLVSADFSPDGGLLAALTGLHKDGKQLRIWNWQTGSQVCPPVKIESEPVWVAFAPDGKAVAVHCMNGAAILIDPATGGELLRVQCRATRMVEGSYPWMTGRGTIGFSHDGRTLYTWGSPVVQAWDRATGRERFAVKQTQDCWAVAESPDGRVLATTSYDGYLHFWDAANGNEVQPPIEHPREVMTVNFSPDGRQIATSCGDNQARVWDVATGKLAYAMPPIGWVTDVRFTPDGRFVVTGGANGIRLWDSKTGYAVSQQISTGTGALPQLDISRDGQSAVISGDLDFFSIIDLRPITAAAMHSPDEALLWTELLSSSKITGSTITNLTNAEWLERWRTFKSNHPELREFPLDK